ncbi:MAG: sigma-54-dependent Fis family transcriptional regulator [Deltaproteobacteria bacterium]|nr:MAG: sigma-54-dependent Fis family transcriptional regulator [Deltaproteobacteria bacterium]
MADALLVDDDVSFQAALAELVRAEGFSVETAASLDEARTYLREHTPDLALVDLRLPDGSGLELLREIDSQVATEIVLITGNATVDSAVEALRSGASDYLTKPVDIPRLKSVLANVVRRRELREEIEALRGTLRTLGHFGPLIGASPAMQAVYDMIARVAPTEATVLVQGESGTGKELVAQTVHQLSRRRKGPFVALNCAAVSPTLIESELFGHERGSFTGAARTHKGFFERAEGGTLFLDEISEMPIELQVRLLRVLETGVVARVGGESEFKVDVRVEAATNRQPEQAVAQGKLREDLLYRLSVFPIRLPALRERTGDVELLVRAFLAELNTAEEKQKEISRAALDLLRGHQWPGNVRELKNAVHRAFILADEEIAPEHIPLLRAHAQNGPEAGAPAAGGMVQLKVGCPLAEAERRLILATLDEHGGNKEKTAKALGISLKTLYNKLNRYKTIAAL